MAGTMNETDDRVLTPLNLMVELAGDAATSQLGVVVERLAEERAGAMGIVHEARFVQLDESTVLFLATYDGDFEDDIVDFTNHLGDVFNLLLPNVIDPPPLPVETDPQAFADWVRGRNLPNAGGYYNANPDLTVLDIRVLTDEG